MLSWIFSTLYSMFGPVPKTEAQEQAETRQKTEALKNTAIVALGVGAVYLGYKFATQQREASSLSELSPSHARLLAMADDLEDQ